MRILVISDVDQELLRLRGVLARSRSAAVVQDIGSLDTVGLRGTKNMRRDAIESYKSGASNVFMLNTSRDAAGVDGLQCTTMIVFLEESVSQAMRAQAIGRVLRMGYTHTIPLRIVSFQCLRAGSN